MSEVVGGSASLLEGSPSGLTSCQAVSLRGQRRPRTLALQHVLKYTSRSTRLPSPWLSSAVCRLCVRSKWWYPLEARSVSRSLCCCNQAVPLHGDLVVPFVPTDAPGWVGGCRWDALPRSGARAGPRRGEKVHTVSVSRGSALGSARPHAGPFLVGARCSIWLVGSPTPILPRRGLCLPLPPPPATPRGLWFARGGEGMKLRGARTLARRHIASK